MAESATPSVPRPSSSGNQLARFPLEVRGAHEKFVASGDPAALDIVVLAVVFDHQPAHARGKSSSELNDTARLIADLGFDSLALAEIVFFIEDLYQISITNDELMSIVTVGELRAFIRKKFENVRAN